MGDDIVKRFTIGITTHNESASISGLLNSLLKLRPDEADVILYDDCSDDDTRSIIESHPIFGRSNFHAFFSETNHGTPSVGRQYVGAHARTEYSVLIDGDDSIDISEFRRFIREAKSGFDIIVSAYLLRGKVVKLPTPQGPIAVDNTSILRIMSAIAGKAYRSSLLEEFGHDQVKGRSDDVRLNMRILAAIRPRIYSIPEICFYVQHASRKSIRVATLNFEEIETREKRYHDLKDLYNIDDRYLAALKRNLIKVINDDDSVHKGQKIIYHNKISRIFNFHLKRVIFLVEDISAIGGIAGRLRNIIMNSSEREVEYYIFSRKLSNPNIINDSRIFVADNDEYGMLSALEDWNNCDTVILTANNIMKAFKNSIKNKIRQFPIIHMFSGQMAFFIQDTFAIADKNLVSQTRASAIISLSDMDIAFQRQLGIHGQVKGFLPVTERAANPYKPANPYRLGYVGRIDFRTKGCDILIDVARAARDAGMPPMRIFTTAAGNSPDYNAFRQMIQEEGLEDQFDFTLECTDKDEIYKDISVLILPSRKESFGNVILEAYSYGIPVISTSYAPGPSELIEHGRTGYLLDDFSGASVVDLLSQTDELQIQRMSKAAFEKHKNYSMDAHFDFLEKIGKDVLNRFNGKNELPVFPKLKLTSRLSTAKRKIPASLLNIGRRLPMPIKRRVKIWMGL